MRTLIAGALLLETCETEQSLPFSLVIFLYVLFSRIFPLIPVWEVYEGQVLQGLRRIGRALVRTRAEPD